MTTQQQYRKSHRIAKSIVCALVILMLILSRSYDYIAFDVLAVIIWFFGVNPIGYLVETVLHFKHKHPKF